MSSTARPGGQSVVKSFVLDYVLMALCAVTAFAIEQIEPFHQLTFMEDRYNFPMSHRERVPPFLLPFVCFGLPLVIIFLVARYYGHQRWMLMISILGNSRFYINHMKDCALAHARPI